MISYLIDTDVVIDFLKGKEESINKLSSLYEKGLAISVISLSELYECDTQTSVTAGLIAGNPIHVENFSTALCNRL